MNEKKSKLMISSDSLYGITMNPEEQCYESKNDLQFISAYAHFINQLSKLKHVFPYVELYPEYSPGKVFKKQSSRPRLHFHGCCRIDPYAYYTYGVHRIMLTNMINIDDKPDYEYCTKNRQVMTELFTNPNKFPYQITWDTFKNKELMDRLKVNYREASVSVKNTFRRSVEDNQLDD